MNPLLMAYRAVIAKVTPFFSKIRMWLSWSYIGNKLNMAIRSATTKIFRVRPKDKDDYYPIFGWMVAKRLVTAVAIALVCICCAYIVSVMPAKTLRTGIKNYKYNSIVLKYIKSGRVGILGKSGYLAYVGDVADGVVEGTGRLYSKEGTLIYTGEFQNNEYNGKGKRYYNNEALWYDGEFTDNMFNGHGVVYRPDGSKLYEGGFVSDKKDGDGKLYDSAGNVIFEGLFSRDELVYKQLLGKTSDELSAYYKGEGKLYTSNDRFIKTMPAIGAMCKGGNGQDTLEGKAIIDGVYIFDDHFISEKGEEIKETKALKDVLGDPVYQGNTDLLLEDAMAVSQSDEVSAYLKNSVKINKSDLLKDAASITGYEADLPVYIYVYHYADTSYTFYTEESKAGFFMYLVQPIEAGPEG